jgi:hypothetical protein
MNHKLLTCGIVAGPLFVTTVLAQAFTRDGFDLGRHPISLLSLGDLGWIQIANFVVTGALVLACAVALDAGWSSRLVGAFGLGLIMAGVFVTDAGAGFPEGAPASAPEQISWHGALHEVGFGVAFLSWLAACVVLARRSTSRTTRAACVAAPVAVLVLAAWPDLDGLSVRLLIASAIQFGVVAVLAIQALPTSANASRAPVAVS